MTKLIKGINDLCFIDSETRRPSKDPGGSVVDVGAYRYAQRAFATVWAFAIGDEPTGLMALDDGFDERLTWELDAPDALKRFHDRVLGGKAWYAAWNMNFDRNIWNGPQSDFPEIQPEHTIDVMAQAVVSGLAGKLGVAAEWCGASGKMSEGKSLISKFEPPHGCTPFSDPDGWQTFKDYGVADVDALRGIYRRTRPLPREEWEDYWVSERINDRGIAADVPFCEAADCATQVNTTRMNEQIDLLTLGKVKAVTMASAMQAWAVSKLDEYPGALALFVKLHEVTDDNGVVTRPEKLAMDRGRIERILAYLENLPDGGTEDTRAVHAVLTLRLYGGSATPKKFGKAASIAHEGRLKGQYVFNGAAQTGRYASRGIQLHNLTRSHLGDDEIAAIELVNEIGKTYAE